MGSICYMICFFLQSIMLLATFFFGWILFVRLFIFLKPDSDDTPESDDMFHDVNKSSFERKRDVIRKSFKPQFFRMNVVLLYILFVLTIRTITYVWLRLTSHEKIFDWLLIKPSIFYITYVTDVMITLGILLFVMGSTTLKEKYRPLEQQSEPSIFPAQEFPNSEVGINQERRVIRSNSDSSVDGDALI